MSRLIVKNLPKTLEKEKLAELFAAHGELTDVRICRKASGESRRFGFVGFKDEECASKALTYFDKSYIGTSKIDVGIAKDIGDETVPRPWSKYSSQSSAFKRNSKDKEERKERIKILQEEISLTRSSGENTDKNSKRSGIAKENLDKKSKNEEIEFDEFMKAHQKPSQKKIWSNETFDLDSANSKAAEKKLSSKMNISEEKLPLKTKKEKKKKIKKDVDKESSKEDKLLSQPDKDPDIIELEDIKKDKKSDMDWLQSKIIKKNDKKESENEGEEGSSNEEDNSKTKNEIKENMEDYNESESSSESDDEAASVNEEDDETSFSDFTLKMRGIPFTCTEKQIIEFFYPLKILDIRMPSDEKGRKTGYAFVDFESETDTKNGLKKNKSKIKNRYVELFRMEEDSQKQKAGIKPWMKKAIAQNEEEETVAESGRLFLRNLTYTCTEDDIRTLFEKYGPVAEVHLPIDKVTKRLTGIGFVTYLMPEHAVAAINELDGKVFQGRFLHIIPARGKKSKDEESFNAEGSSYKKEKAAKMKNLSASGHNWNTLFLGQNAIVDALAQRMNVGKDKILDTENAESLAVRMALGETQLVAETREFLTSHGVKLDSFGQVNTKRSTEVILVKNLPHGTKAVELRNLFGKFGDLANVLLPPSGITAIIQFTQPTEARAAFKCLAYSKFKHVPLYLEWAPSDVFSDLPVQPKREDTNKEEETENVENDADDTSAENSSRIIFVKNLNFDTTEDDIQKHFEKCGKIKSVTIARKKDPKKPEKLLSMGYGFVKFKKKEDADEAIKTLQYSMLDDHQLELKKSHRKEEESTTSRKRAVTKKQKTSKILVRNVPFEASKKEIKQLFGTFGELKTVRIPKKVAGTGNHRGFAFVDFVSKQDAKRAFESLCQSTHLYGRRLVLEWAEDDETVDSIREKTALHYSEEPLKKRKKQDLIDALDETNNESAL